MSHVVAFLVGLVVFAPIVLGVLFAPKVMGYATFVLLLGFCAWGLGWFVVAAWRER